MDYLLSIRGSQIVLIDYYSRAEKNAELFLHGQVCFRPEALILGDVYLDFEFFFIMCNNSKQLDSQSTFRISLMVEKR